jgi:uncharacterized repeat protein (TIGR03803 family)
MAWQVEKQRKRIYFSYDPSFPLIQSVTDFNGTNGCFSVASLMQAKDGKLYGMTYAGGSYGYDYGGGGYGVIFSFDPSSSTYKKLKDIDYYTTGAHPRGSLMQANDGKLYGMTNRGGYADAGVIFSVDPSSSTYTTLKDFDGSYGEGGAYPTGSLMQASDGKLYGMTANSGGYDGDRTGYGVIFSFDPSTSTYTMRKDFDGTNGANPLAALCRQANGKLYGMTLHGGKQRRRCYFFL